MSDYQIVELALVQVSKDGDSALRHVSELIYEYTQYLLQHRCDVGSFQDLEVELKELPGRYSREFGGCLLVAYPGQSAYVTGLEVVHREVIQVQDGALNDADAIACVAVKALPQEGTCEMKRMFVREKSRGLGIGKLLVRAAIREAMNAGVYHTIKLDSLERLPGAVSLYEGMGFRKCDAYVSNPESDAVYLEMMLPVRPQFAAEEYDHPAQIFVAARRVPNCSIGVAPVVSSIKDAYAVHSAIARSSAPVAGWKVGATNEASMKFLGLNHPFRGPLFSPDIRRGPASVAWEELAAAIIAVEVEFAFCMSAALEPRPEPYTEDEVWAAVHTMHPTIEIAASRCPPLLPPRAETVTQCIADFGLVGVVVIGKGIPKDKIDIRIRSLPQLTATIARTGQGKDISAQGEGTHVMGSPIKSLCWLANTLRVDGITLQDGAVVASVAAALLLSDKVPWGQQCTLQGTLGGLAVDLGECSVKVELPDI